MITINLLPIAAFKQQSKGKKFLVFYCFFMVISLSGMFVVKSSMFDIAIETLTTEKSQAESALTKAQQQVKAAAGVTGATVGRWKQLAAIVELEERRRDQTRLLVEMEDLLPKTNAWLLSLTHNNGQMSLEGISTDKETVSQFLTRLENATYIQKDSVILMQISQDMIINGIKLTKFSIMAQTAFPRPAIVDGGLPEFGLPSREEFIKIVSAADGALVADLKDKDGAASGARKGL